MKPSTDSTRSSPRWLPGSTPRRARPGATGEPTQAEQGYLHCGPNGAGHFVKMVHNGIEYGIMAAYAEGLAILERADIGARDARRTPRRRRCSTPSSTSTTSTSRRSPSCGGEGRLSARGCSTSPRTRSSSHPSSTEFTGRVSDSGEGRWTAQAAVEVGVPAHVLTAALFERFASQGDADFANKLQSAMRKQFGGHIEKIVQQESMK